MNLIRALTSLIFLSVYLAAKTASAQKPPVLMIDTLLHQASAHSIGSGSISGFGGGDTVDQRKISAWFYGTHPINVCYSRLETFGVSESEVRASIQRSFALWRDYVVAKKIKDSSSAQINTRFTLRGKCRGGEDLVIYLGTGPIFQNLLDLKLFQSLSKPIAYVNKTHLSKDLSWSKGYIRFVEDFSYQVEGRFYPDWSQGENFQLMLTHEIGHILGFGHAPETIMTGQIVRDLFVENKNYSHKIDFSKELYPCETCVSKYKTQSILQPLPFFQDLYITIKDNKIEFIQASKKLPVRISHIEKQSRPSSLITNFSQEDKLVPFNKLYFFSYSDQEFIALKEDNLLKIFSKGVHAATFERTPL